MCLSNDVLINELKEVVIPAEAGIQVIKKHKRPWMPDRVRHDEKRITIELCRVFRIYRSGFSFHAGLQAVAERH
jgi:hypothetical protein